MSLPFRKAYPGSGQAEPLHLLEDPSLPAALCGATSPVGWTLAELDDRTVVCQHCRAKAQSLRKPGFVRASPTGDRIESYVQARLADQHDVYGWSASGGVAVILAALGVDRGSFPKRIDGVYLLVLGVLEPEPHKGQARRA